MNKSSKICSIIIIIFTFFSLTLSSCERASEEDMRPNIKNKVMLDEEENPEVTDVDTNAENADKKTRENIDKMTPVFDGIMRAMLITGKKYTTSDSDFTWRAIYVAVTQGVPTHNEYIIYNEEMDVCVSTSAIAELNYSLFAKSMQLNKFPNNQSFVVYSNSIDSFLFASNDFSELSTRIINYSRTEDGFLSVNVMLMDEESGYYVTFGFTLDDNRYYTNSETAYPYCVMDVIKIEEAED